MKNLVLLLAIFVGSVLVAPVFANGVYFENSIGYAIIGEERKYESNVLDQNVGVSISDYVVRVGNFRLNDIRIKNENHMFANKRPRGKLVAYYVDFSRRYQFRHFDVEFGGGAFQYEMEISKHNIDFGRDTAYSLMASFRIEKQLLNWFSIKHKAILMEDVSGERVFLPQVGIGLNIPF